MRIAMIYQNLPAFMYGDHETHGLGGSENGFLRTVEHLLKRGHEVHVYNRADVPPTDYGAGLQWANLQFFDPNRRDYDVIYSLRHREVFEKAKVRAKLRVLFLADTESVGLGESVKAGNIDLVMAVSHWQKEKIAREEHLPDDYWMVTSNGVEVAPLSLEKKVLGRCLFSATPERGLSELLDIWPRIRAEVPTATLHVYSSFMGWGHTREENEKMCEAIYARMEMMKPLGVVNCRHGNAAQIRTAQEEAEFYLYPSDFWETCCMSVLEAMLAGALPVVTGRAGLLEKVLPGVTGEVVPAYGCGTRRYQDIFVEETVNLLAASPTGFLETMRHNAYAFASQFSYTRLVPGWIQEWERRIRAK